MQQYQQHKQQLHELKDKLEFLKARNQLTQQMPSPSQQQKQKKKPRPLEQDDTVSMNVNMSDPFGKSTLRHSMRSLQNPTFNNNTMDQRYMGHPRVPYRTSDAVSLADGRPYIRQEDVLVSGIYRLSLNGYKNYVER